MNRRACIQRTNAGAMSLSLFNFGLRQKKCSECAFLKFDSIDISAKRQVNGAFYIIKRAA